MTVALSLIRCSHPPARSLPSPSMAWKLGKIFLLLFTPVPTLDHLGRKPYKATSWLARNTKDMAHMPLQG